MLEIKNTVTEMNAFDGLICRLKVTEERLNILENVNIYLLRLKCSEKQTKK